MLLVKHPEKSDLLAVLQSLRDGETTREEVESWYRAVEKEYAPVELSVDEGLWYYRSLSALTIPIALDDGQPWFVRDRDIEEYLLDLQQVPCQQSYEGVTRVRHHQTDTDSIRWPLVMFEHTNPWHLDERGLTTVRGIFDPHGDLVEHTHLYFRGDLYLIVRQYDDQAHQLMVLGTNREEEQLKALLDTLELV